MRSHARPLVALTAAVLLAVAGYLSTRESGAVRPMEGPPGPVAEAGVPVAQADAALGDVAHEVPDGWTVRTFEGLAYAVPPATGGGAGSDEPATDGVRHSTWQGDLLPATLLSDTTGGLYGLAQSVTVHAHSDATWDGRIRGDSARTYSATIPGASRVGASIAEAGVPVFDADGNLLGEPAIATIWIFVQADAGASYDLVVTAGPGGEAEQVLRRFLSTLSLG